MEYLKFVMEELKSLSAYYVDNKEYLKTKRIDETIKELEEVTCLIKAKKS